MPPRRPKEPTTKQLALLAAAQAQEAKANGGIIVSFTRTSDPPGYKVLFNGEPILVPVGYGPDNPYNFVGFFDTGEAFNRSSRHLDAHGTTMTLKNGIVDHLELRPTLAYPYFGIKPETWDILKPPIGGILYPTIGDLNTVIKIWIPLCQYLFVYHIYLEKVVKPVAEQVAEQEPDPNKPFNSVSGIPLNKEVGKTTTYYLTPEIIIDALIFFVKKYGELESHKVYIVIFTILRKILSNMPSEANNNNIDILRPDLIDLLTQGQGGGSRKLRSKRRKRKNSSKRKRKTNKRKRRRT
jgi:hypothetical protein